MRREHSGHLTTRETLDEFQRRWTTNAGSSERSTSKATSARGTTECEDCKPSAGPTRTLPSNNPWRNHASPASTSDPHADTTSYADTYSYAGTTSRAPISTMHRSPPENSFLSEEHTNDFDFHPGIDSDLPPPTYEEAMARPSSFDPSIIHSSSSNFEAPQTTWNDDLIDFTAGGTATVRGRTECPSSVRDDSSWDGSTLGSNTPPRSHANQESHLDDLIGLSITAPTLRPTNGPSSTYRSNTASGTLYPDSPGSRTFDPAYPSSARPTSASPRRIPLPTQQTYQSEWDGHKPIVYGAAGFSIAMTLGSLALSSYFT